MGASMRYTAEQKQQTRKRIVAAAGRSFKKGGYSGIGVDGLAKEAGVTSGAFYGHFKSKEEAFKEAIVSELDELSSAITNLKQAHGENWWTEFADFYTSQKRTCDLSDSCGLQSLTPEVGRSNDDVRAVFETELLEIAGLASKKDDMDKTWASLAMLIGGVTLSRAVKDEKLSNKIAEAIRKEVVAAHKS